MDNSTAGEWIISPAPHLGDAYFTCALAEPFLRKHGGSRVRIVIPKRMWSLFTIFPGARIAGMEPHDVTVPYRQTPGFAMQEPFYLRPFNVLDAFANAYAGGEMPFTRAYHDLLDLPFPSFEPPTVPETVRHTAEQRMMELNLPRGRTVILVPVSKSLTPFSTWFWNDLAEVFLKQGYSVATTVSFDQLQRCAAGTTLLECPSEELIPVAEWAGTVVSARCGVCDILSSAHIDLRIVYQRPHVEWSPLQGVTVLWDLGDCGLEDHATYYRVGISEPQIDFVHRVAAGAR